MIDSIWFNKLFDEFVYNINNYTLNVDEMLIEYDMCKRPITLDSSRHYDVSVGITKREYDLSIDDAYSQLILPGMSALYEKISMWDRDTYVFADPYSDDDDRNIIHTATVESKGITIRMFYYEKDHQHILSFDASIFPK